MVGTKQGKLSRPKGLHGRSHAATQADMVLSMLAEALSTERWGACHRLIHGLELLTTGQPEAAWRASHAKDASEPWEVAAFRTRAGETPLPAAQLLAMLEAK